MFKKYTTPADKNMLLWLYRDKVRNRVEELITQNTYWQQTINSEKIKINNRQYKNIKSLMPAIIDFAEKISDNRMLNVIHGDFCFSNILFDASDYLFKLIDPRGRMNNEATIFGDPRYDIAKLRHSVYGMYDFIVQGLYTLSEENDGFTFKILSPDYSVLEKLFDNLTEKFGYSVKEIKFIEGLLFLSMLPLHKEDFKRQKALYLRAVMLLNNVLTI